MADESVEGPTVERLRRDGHDVLYIAELDPGIADPGVLSFARAEKSILLTADKDFGELVFRGKELHFGVLLLRLSDGELEENAAATSAVLEEHGEEMQDRFSSTWEKPPMPPTARPIRRGA